MMFIEELKPNLNLQSKSIFVGNTFLFYFILFIFLNTWLYIIRHWHHKHQKMMGRTECSVHYFCQYWRGAHDYDDQVPFVVNHAPVAQLVEYQVAMQEVVSYTSARPLLNNWVEIAAFVINHYISKWLDFPVFLNKDYKPEIPNPHPSLVNNYSWRVGHGVLGVVVWSFSVAKCGWLGMGF